MHTNAHALQQLAQEAQFEINQYKAESQGSVVINAHNATDSIFRSKRQAPGCEGAYESAPQPF